MINGRFRLKRPLSYRQALRHAPARPPPVSRSHPESQVRVMIGDARPPGGAVVSRGNEAGKG